MSSNTYFGVAPYLKVYNPDIEVNVESNKKTCLNCNTITNKNDKFCKHCGSNDFMAIRENRTESKFDLNLEEIWDVFAPSILHEGDFTYYIGEGLNDADYHYNDSIKSFDSKNIQSWIDEFKKEYESAIKLITSIVGEKNISIEFGFYKYRH